MKPRNKFIRCEDGSYVHVKNVTRLSLQTDFHDQTKIMAHHNGPGMPFPVAEFSARKDAQLWLTDLIERIEFGTPEPRMPKPGPSPRTTENLTGPYPER